MFFKKELRPQTAGAPTPENRWSRSFSAMTFSAADGDPGDFGGFEDYDRTPPPERKGGGSFFDKIKKIDRKIIIIVAAVVAVAAILTSVLAVALFKGDGNIRYEDNAYMTYVDSQDKYHIIANGEVIAQEFEGEVELIPAADNSFAYVFDHGDEGLYMYILKGKKIEKIYNAAVEDYLATASIEPGIVFVESGSSGMKYMLYNTQKGVRQITKEKQDPDNFIISGDGMTVVYTTADSDSSDRVLNMYDNGKWSKVTNTSCTPVALSNYGDYIYVEKLNNNGADQLYAIDLTKKNNDIFPVKDSENFLYILEMNVKGDEVIFCTGEGPDSFMDVLDGDVFEVKSFLYRHKAKTDDASVVALGANFITTADGAAPDVAIYKTFAGAYLETDVYEAVDQSEYTYRLSNKFEVETIQKYKGQFTSDGKYFYYINKNDDLVQLNLKSDTRDTLTILSDIKDFSITKKGNIYALDSDYYIWFHKASNGDQDMISSEATAISMHLNSNKLYFSEEDSEVIKTSEEGSQMDIAKFGSSELKAVPYFSAQNTKKAYAVAFDETAETYYIYYTSNGNRFSLVKSATGCEEILYGIEIPESIEW